MSALKEEDLLFPEETTADSGVALSAAMNTKTPSNGVPIITPDDIVSRISEKVASEIAAQMLGGGPPSGGPPPEPPESPESLHFGMTSKKWGSFFLKVAGVAVVAIFAWYNFVNSAIEESATKAEVEDMADGIEDHMSAVVESHEQHGIHSDTDAMLKAHSEQLKKLSEIQIRQTIILENQGETLGEIKDDLRRERRRRR